VAHQNGAGAYDVKGNEEPRNAQDPWA
jgi:hypothetical protein